MKRQLWISGGKCFLFLQVRHLSAPGLVEPGSGLIEAADAVVKSRRACSTPGCRWAMKPPTKSVQSDSPYDRGDQSQIQSKHHLGSRELLKKSALTLFPEILEMENDFQETLKGSESDFPGNAMSDDGLNATTDLKQHQHTDPKALSWAERNPWFGSDMEMTLFAYRVHDELVAQGQVDCQSDAYYKSIEQQVSLAFPDNFTYRRPLKENSSPSQSTKEMDRLGDRHTSSVETFNLGCFALSPSQASHSCIGSLLQIPTSHHHNRPHKSN